MELNKLETQFKTKLNAREIKPSEMAWDRLDAMLTVAEKPKRSFRWMYIAASFLGFILIATVFFSQTENVVDKDKVVFGKEKIFKNQKDLKNQKNQNELYNQNQIVEKSIINQETNQKNQKVLKNPNVINNQNQLVKNSIINQKTNLENEKNETQVVFQNPIIFESNKESQKVVIANTLDQNEEAILANVSPKKTDVTKINVNPNDLLSQVDNELELTFREKVIKSVSKNFKSIKVAVQNRNN